MLTFGDVEKTKELIREYLSWIDRDLSFQHIDEELFSFPEMNNETVGSFLWQRVGKILIFDKYLISFF